jgi:protease I
MTDQRIAILATDGFEQSELLSPRDHFLDKNASVHVIAPKGKKEIKAWDKDDWGKTVAVDQSIDEVSVDDYDALILPGGQMNPDVLRLNDSALDFIKAFAKTGKPLAAICHAPWLLVETGIAKGKRLTSYKSIKTDMKNAGARWEDSACVVDGNLITSRNPGDLKQFNAAIEKALNEVATPA